MRSFVLFPAILTGALLLHGCALPPPKDFHPETFQGPMGKLILSSPFPGFLVVRDLKAGERFRLEGEKGLFPSPAGSFLVESVEFREKDRKGRRWRVVSELLEQGRGIRVNLEPGGRKSLNLGFPLVGKVVAYRKGAHYYTFDPRLLGRGGESYFLDCLDQKLGFPGFRIFTASGRVLKEDVFTYG